MICWSCERAAGEGPLCAACGAILPPDLTADHFAVLGLPRRYDIDIAAAEAGFRSLSRQFHPDRFAKAEPRGRRASLQRSVQLNEAWRTIKDPVRRAEYLLHLAGYDMGGEGAGERQSPGPGQGLASGQAGQGQKAAPRKVPVPPQLLGEILELREELGEARAAEDHARVEAMATTMRERLARSLSVVEGALAHRPEASEADRRGAWDQAAGELIAIRYFRRFLDEVAAHDESVAAAAEGAAHA